MKATSFLCIAGLLIASQAMSRTYEEYDMTEKEYKVQMDFVKTATDSTLEDIDRVVASYKDLAEQRPAKKLNFDLRIAALTAMRADHYFLPNKKIAFLNEAIRIFDNVERKIEKQDKLKKATVNLQYEFHFYRARTLIEVPSFLDKRSTAMADFATASQLVETEQLHRPKEELGGFYLKYASELQEDERAIKAVQFAKKSMGQFLTKEELEAAREIITNKGEKGWSLF